MKKIVFFSVSIFFSFFCFWNTDIVDANFLAEKWIIKQQNSIETYRLDEKITRAEALWVALQLGWIKLPENYQCKKYFADVSKSDWICRIIELSADYGLISRKNSKARPQDIVTRAESLAIILMAIYREKTITPYYQYVFSADTTEWQKNIFYLAQAKSAHNTSGIVGTQYWYDPESGRTTTINYFPNLSSTRGEFFWFARNMLGWEMNIPYFDIVRYSGSAIKGAIGEVYSLSFWDKIIVNTEQGTFDTLECDISIYPASRTMDLLNTYVHINWVSSQSGNLYIIASTVIWLTHKVILGENYVYVLNEFGDEQCLLNISIAHLREISPAIVLDTYYGFLNKKDYYWAINLRSDTQLTHEQLNAWYAGTSSITWREESLKDLGNDTYEFLVDITENGIKSTYKVKSKVDVENFKINNISSVKQ